jgi:hypothetical protein
VERPPTFTLCCVLDDDPRFFVEIVLWVMCVQRSLPAERFRPVVYVVGAVPADLLAWLRLRGIETRPTERALDGSPHCNKILPFFDAHETDYTIVCDTDLYFVADPSGFLASGRFRAPPNNHCHPPAWVLRSVLAASGIGRPYRPGMALFPDAGSRETHINNISAGLVLAPSAKSRVFAELWLKWAKWLIDHRNLLEEWALHVDQVGFMLAVEELGEDVELLPPQVNAILHILDEIESPYALHLSTAHIPNFPERFNADRTLMTNGFPDGVRDRVEALNHAIASAMAVLLALPSTQPHIDKFLNPAWRR